MIRRILIASSLIIPGLALAASVPDDPLCSTPVRKDTTGLFSPDGKIHLSADKVEVSEEELSRFSGNVVIQEKNARIETDIAEYSRKHKQVDAKGKVRFITDSIIVSGDSARFKLNKDQAILLNSQYQSQETRARGSAKKIEIKSKTETELSQATYTTCEPGKTDWLLTAESINLNTQTQQGHASHVVLRFKDVPFFYFPYLRFPIGEERLSGFLFPYIGSSSLHGSELQLPYYWNIHPQLDATLTPRLMTRRGLMLQTELRYLTRNQQGQFYSEYLGFDRVYGTKRERWSWQHATAPGPGWQFVADYNAVADVQHLSDFSNTLNTTSTTYLQRRGDLIYNSDNWIFKLRAEDNQVLSGTEIYKRLPQITFNTRLAEKNNQFNYRLSSEAVRFAQIDSSKVVGERLHLKPEIYYPYKTAAGFLNTRLAWQLTNYNLQQGTTRSQYNRSVPSFSMNGGLFFERDSRWFNTDYLQTLEPQLLYVFVPYVDQSALPNFDTSVYAYNVNSPFADYRFNGIDRIGDDNRLTTAVTTRFIRQQDGREILKASLGQIQYFSDRRVNLDNSVATRSRSNLIAELRFTPARWSLTSQLEWDPYKKETVFSSTRASYSDKNLSLSLAHRLQLGSLETTEAKLDWKINERWKLNTSYLYNNRDRHLVESLFAVNYETCCWGLRLTGKERYLSSTQSDRGIYLELVLKGLGNFGFAQ